MFAGGLIGESAGGALGNVAGGVGMAGGVLAGGRANDAASGLPERIVAAVTASAVLGFDSSGFGRRPGPQLFTLPRERLTTKVHQRVNVRISPGTAKTRVAGGTSGPHGRNHAR